MNQQQVQITLPDDAAKVRYEATVPRKSTSPQPETLVPCSTDPQRGDLPRDRSTTGRFGNLYGMPLAWRGLQLLGGVIGITAVWYVGVWIAYGRMPLLPTHDFWGGIGHLDPILPPMWLVALLGPFTLISLVMMLLGTQDANPKIRAPE